MDDQAIAGRLKSAPVPTALEGCSDAGALKDLAAILDQRFLHTGGPPTDVFAAYAADHGRDDAQP